MRNERARDTGNRTYLARRCRPVLLAQLYYAGRELLFCCGVLTAFFVFFVAEGWFDSFTLEHFADTSLRLRSFETTSLFLAPFSNLNFFVKNRHFFFATELMKIH